MDFYRGWNDYKNGFGKIGSEFWLGNEKIYYLSVQATYELRIDMWDWEDITRGTSTQTGNYYQGGSSFFFVEDEKNFYKLRVPEVRRQKSWRAFDILMYKNILYHIVSYLMISYIITRFIGMSFDDNEIIILLLAGFSYQWELIVFHWNLSDSKPP